MNYVHVELESVPIGHRHRITPGTRLWLVDLENHRVTKTPPIVAAYTHTLGGTVLVAQDYSLYSPVFCHVERNEAVCELRRHLQLREAVAGKDLDAIRAALHELSREPTDPLPPVTITEEPTAP